MDNALVIALWLISVFMLVISVHNMLRERRLTRKRREIDAHLGEVLTDGDV